MLILRPLLLSFMVVGYTGFSCSGWSFETPAEEKLAFVLEMVLGAEYFSDDDRVARWAIEPDIGLLGASAEDEKFVRGMVKELTSICAAGIQSKLKQDYHFDMKPRIETLPEKKFIGNRIKMSMVEDKHNTSDQKQRLA